jgi:tetratricopeptide (TPR) repeat protein
MNAAGAFGLFAALSLGASTAQADPWSKALSRCGADPALVENPIAITPDIEAAAFTLSGGTGDALSQLRSLQSALFDPSRFTFDYDAHLTETASQALRSGRGNCVAFTNLFIAMGRARGIPVKAGVVAPRVNGVKRGDLVYVTTHVVAVYAHAGRLVTFDFNRSRDDSDVHVRLVDDLELAALYVNNRAVDALGEGEFALAESRLDQVLKLAPGFAAAHGNLGVLRRRRGDTSGALDAYRRALAIDPKDPAILGNLAALYSGLGREREARAALSLADLSRASPYTMLARGDLEAADGRVDEALRFYRRAARLDPKIPEPQVSIARAARSAGRIDEARRAAARAVKLDPGNVEASSILGGLPAD